MRLRQDYPAKNMVFGVDYLVWYLSQFMTLCPGDVDGPGRQQQTFLAA